MRKILLSVCFFTSAVLLSGCGCTYNVINRDTGVIENSMKADAPGGEAVIMLVYFNDPNVAPIIKAGVDSSDLVNATAAVGRQAVDIAMKFYMK